MAVRVRRVPGGLSVEREVRAPDARRRARRAPRSCRAGSHGAARRGCGRFPTRLRRPAVRAPLRRRYATKRHRCARESSPGSSMIEVPAPQRAQAAAIQQRLKEGLGRIDPHHRLLGRPVSYRIIDGTTLEITYRDVPGIAEAEVLGVKRLIGVECFCTVAPQTAETVLVRFVVSLK